MKKSFSVVKPQSNILSDSMKAPHDAAEVFAEYLSYWMKERGMDSRAVVDKARRLHGSLSDATMHNILSAKPADMMVRTVEVLAETIRRPPEEVFMAKLGYAKIPPAKEGEIQLSELAYIERRLERMPHGEHRRAIIRFLRMIEKEIDETPHQGDRK